MIGYQDKINQILRGAETIKNMKHMKRNLHSPLKIEIVLKAHYHSKYMINRWNKVEVEVATQLLKDHILVRFAEHDSDADQLTLTEKGKAFVEMILNTPYPVQSWTDPRN